MLQGGRRAWQLVNQIFLKGKPVPMIDVPKVLKAGERGAMEMLSGLGLAAPRLGNGFKTPQVLFQGANMRFVIVQQFIFVLKYAYISFTNYFLNECGLVAKNSRRRRVITFIEDRLFIIYLFFN